MIKVANFTTTIFGVEKAATVLPIPFFLVGL
jgi:hypothetical protein